GVSHDAMEAFMEYHWPGNIRELKNAMEYSFVTTEGPAIKPNHLPKKITAPSPPPVKAVAKEEVLPDEKSQLIQALKQTKGNQSKAAKLLNINRVTVWNRMKKYGIDLKKVLSV
ncbi:MAG: sigma-54-dependent Fis family transcriptional regulator, partial [Desulfobacteraceae bacterium]|nr:sigma-54-dependent Fis family transcriptional regulator [Desulfobacteraceae bacterium]